MDFSAPQCVVDAVTAVATHGIYGYTDASEEVQQVTAARMATVYGLDNCTPDQLVWLPGLLPGLNHAVRAVQKLHQRRDVTVAVATPIYPPFLAAPANQGAQLATVPLLAERGGSDSCHLRYTVDLPALHATLADPSVGLLLWCSPHNPTGRVWSRGEMAAVAQACVEHDVLLLSDEVWGEVVLEPELTPFVGAADLINDIPGLRERLIVLTSPSKAFNVAACDIAVAAIADDTLRQTFAAVGVDKAEVTPFGYAALGAAYGSAEAEAWRQRLVTYLLYNRDVVVEQALQRCQAAAGGVVWTRPEASYLTWMQAATGPHKSLWRQLHEAGVTVSSGRAFGDSEFVRVNFGTTREVLQEGMEAVQAGIVSGGGV